MARHAQRRQNARMDQRDYFTGADLTRTPQSEAIYFKEWKEIMDYLYSYPCIGVWVPFNEGWGQLKQKKQPT